MENLELYNKVREVPEDALKKINAGRLSGKSDINPMWRIKTLTEQFGMCGIGWYYDITRQWVEQGANGEVAGFCNINLFVKIGDEWSKAIPGTGGSSFIAKESKGLYTSDEVYKMALTDAISVACKALGIGANVYWDKDKTKYSAQNHESDLSATDEDRQIIEAVDQISRAKSKADLEQFWKNYKALDSEKAQKPISKAISNKRKQLGV